VSAHSETIEFPVGSHETNHWDRSPHTRAWYTSHKGPIKGEPRRTSKNFSTPRIRREIQWTRLSVTFQLESGEARGLSNGNVWNEMWGTHRRHSAQDTGTRPGFLRCRCGGSLPGDELEPWVSNGRIVCTTAGSKSRERSTELAPGCLLSANERHTSASQKRVVQFRWCIVQSARLGSSGRSWESSCVRESE
jgi:hypothetical protein